MRSILTALILAAVVGGGASASDLPRMCSGAPVETAYAPGPEELARVASSIKRWKQQDPALTEACNAAVRAEALADGVRVHFPAGCYGVGVQTRLAIPPMERAWLEYDFCPSADFHFNGGKLPGLIGGAPGGAAGAGGSCERFTARPMFNKPRGDVSALVAGRVNTYAYWCEQPGDYGGCGRECEWNGGAPVLRAGQCAHVGSQVVMNTPGETDGVIRYWVDGALVMEKTDFRFRDDPSVQVNAIFFSVFFGGNHPRWAPLTDSEAEYRNFRVMTDPPSCAP